MGKRHHLMTVTVEGVVNLAAAAKALGVDETALDKEFGVVEIDPDKSLYSVMLEEGAAWRSREKQYPGPFSNPKIAPAGPAQPKKNS